jgi:hypothetical protein
MGMPSLWMAPELIESQERNSRFGRRGRSGAPPETRPASFEVQLASTPGGVFSAVPHRQATEIKLAPGSNAKLHYLS